jgi:putative flippase GtrA
MTFLWSKIAKHLNKYILASLLANAFAYLLYALITKSGLIAQPVITFIVASLISFPLSFFLNRIWVFKSKDKLHYELLRFSFGYLTALVFGSLLLHELLVLLPNPYLAQFVSMIIIGCTGFFLHSFWTFKNNHLASQ